MAYTPPARPWGSDLPLIGKTIAKFGKVGRILTTPCNPEPVIIVEAFFHGAAKAIWSIAKPSALSPHGSPVSESVFGSHGRKRPAKGDGMRYRWNGELIPGPEFQIDGAPGVALWKVPFKLARQVGWYLLIYDAFADGLLNWVSTTYKWSGCPTAGYPYAWCKEGGHLTFNNSVGKLGSCSSSFVHNVAFGAGEAIIPANATYTAMMSLNNKPWDVAPNEYSPASGRIRNMTTGQNWDVPPPGPPKDGVQQSVAFAKAQVAGSGPETIRWEVTGGTHFSEISGSMSYVQVFPFDNLLNDP